MAFTDEQIIKLFSEGVEQATQNVSKIHRIRVLLQGGLVGFLVSALIAFPVAYFVPREAARSNCVAVTELAKLSAKTLAHERTSSREFEEKSHGNRLGLSKGDFAELIERKHNEEREKQQVLERLKDRSC